jgi:hypothetical protein
MDAAFQKVSNNKFPQFDKWSTPIIHVPKQAGSSDCMFFLWKYMEFWDGGRPNIDINPAWWKKYRPEWIPVRGLKVIYFDSCNVL